MGKQFNDKAKANNFVVLDIENPNSRGNSICAIGMLVIEDGTLTRKVRCTHKSRVSNLVFPLPVELVRS